MSSASELLLAKICVEKGWLRPEQLQELLQDSAVRPLSSRLVDKGYVTGAQIDRLRGEVEALVAKGDYRVIRTEDERLGQILFQKGLLTDEQLRKALRIQKNESRVGDSVARLGEILLEMGAVSYSSLQEALREQAHMEWIRCSGCGLSYGISKFDPTKTYLCRKCGGTVALPSDSVSDPPEVRQAREDPKNRIGRYILLRELGRGGMGVVYQAWDSGLRRWIALKLLTSGNRPDELARFQREAQTAASLKHPNIVGIYEVGRDGDRHFIAMEFVDGSTLTGRRLPSRKAVEVMAQIARAVDFAHTKGVLHRDLKPQNILLDREGRPAVTDFGLAKDVRGESDITVSGTILGTPSYMPPEQAEGKVHRLDRRSDVYSLGAVLYELITGRPPFKGRSALETLQHVVHSEPKPPAGAPPEVETVVLKCLEKDRSKRYPSAKLLAEDLERWLRGEAILARRSSVLTQLSRRVRKNRAVLIVGSFLSVVVVFLVALVLLQTSSKKEDRNRRIREAEEAFQRGDWARAESLFEQAGVRDRARACRERIDAEEAAAKLRKEREERDRIARNEAQPHFDEGRRRLEAATRDLYRPGADLSQLDRDLRDALSLFTHALRSFPQFAEAHYHRGLAHFALGEYDAAEADFTRAIQIQPGFSDAYYERARLFIERGSLAWGRSRRRPSLSKQADDYRARARRDLLEFRRLAGSGSKWAEFAEALLAFSEGKLKEAGETCERMIQARTKDEQVYKLLGDVREMESKGDPALLAHAEEAYTRAIALRVNYFEAYHLRGSIRLHRENGNGALDDFTKALTIHPRFADSLVNRGATYYQLGHPQEAEHDFEEALRIDSKMAEAHDNLGVIRFSEKDYRGAIRQYDQSLAIDPDNPVAYANRGAAKRWIDDLDGALRDYEEALRRNPDHVTAYFNRALIHDLRGDPSACLRDLTSFLNRYAKGDLNRERALFLRANSYEKLGKLREAIADWEECLRLESPRRAEVEERIRQARAKAD